MCEASRKVAVDFLFGETKKPDTHRQCTIHMHDRWDMVGLGPCSFEAAIMKQSDFVERVLLTKRPAKEL